MRRLTVAFVLLAVFFAANPALATTATEPQVRELATRARTDPSALEQLKKIDVVDGRRVDMSRALDTSSPAELDARLRTIARVAGAAGSSTARDRAAARDILSGRRYRRSTLPRPFAGLLDRIGRLLGRLWHPIGRHLPHLGPLWWIGAGVLVIGLAIVVTFVLGMRRRSVAAERVAAVRVRSLRPDDLERAAREAEAAGRLAEAIRLRFAAGLVRLDRAGVIEWHPSITSGDVRRLLHSEMFDDVASSFERVTYGKRTPTGDDVELSKAGWQDVLERVR